MYSDHLCCGLDLHVVIRPDVHRYAMLEASPMESRSELVLAFVSMYVIGL